MSEKLITQQNKNFMQNVKRGAKSSKNNLLNAVNKTKIIIIACGENDGGY